MGYDRRQLGYFCGQQRAYVGLFFGWDVFRSNPGFIAYRHFGGKLYRITRATKSRMLVDLARCDEWPDEFPTLRQRCTVARAIAFSTQYAAPGSTAEKLQLRALDEFNSLKHTLADEV